MKRSFPRVAPVRSFASFRDVEVEDLTRLVWNREKCPPHRRLACRREVEMQLRVTRGWLLRELGAGAAALS